MKIFGIIVALIIVSVVGYGVYWVWTKARYRTAKSNTALIVTGPNLKADKGLDNIYETEEGKKVKVVRGGGTLLRRFQKSVEIELTSMKLNIPVSGVPTLQVVPVNAEVVSMIKVSDTKEGIVWYAEQFLGKKQDIIEAEISEVIGATLRAILSSMTVEDINQDRKKFSSKVQEVAEPKLKKMGFEIISLDLAKLTDNEGYIDALGKEQISEVKKTSNIAEAKNLKEQANTEAQINLEKVKELEKIAKQKSDAELETRLAIIENEKAQATKEKEKELMLEQIEIENAKQVQVKEKERELALAEQDAKISQTQAEKRLILSETQAKEDKVKKDLEAYKAEKDLAVQAKQISLEGEEQAKAEISKGEAKARAILVEGQAKAQVEKELGEIQARNKKLEAEAIAIHKEVVLAEKLIEKMPEIVGAIAEPLSKIDSVKIYGNGNGEGGVQGYSNDIVSTIAQVMDKTEGLTGLNIGDLLTNLSTKGNTHTVVLPQAVEEKEALSTVASVESKETEEVEEVKEAEAVEEVKEDETK